jgi:hypothetical protein
MNIRITIEAEFVPPINQVVDENAACKEIMDIIEGKGEFITKARDALIEELVKNGEYFNWNVNIGGLWKTVEVP